MTHLEYLNIFPAFATLSGICLPIMKNITVPLKIFLLFPGLIDIFIIFILCFGEVQEFKAIVNI